MAAPIVYLCARVEGKSRLLKEVCQVAAAAASLFERVDVLVISKCVVLDDLRGGTP